MFRVPEKHRITTGLLGTGPDDGNNGAFYIPGSGRLDFFVIASDGMGWEHVSAHAYDPRSTKAYTPTWDQMCFIKALFWEEEDLVIQYHPPKSEYVNNQPNTLHLWRPIEAEVPAPPSALVGIKA